MAAMHGVMARTAVITSDSRGPIVNIIGWIAMVITCLSVITVLVSKYIILRKLSWNDLLLTFAMLFFVGQTVATSEQVAAGLGRHLVTVSAADYVKFQKTGYAASLFYIAALACGKISTLALLLALTPVPAQCRIILAIGGLVGAWAVGSLLASAFQCNLPQAWAYETGKCFNQLVLWETIGGCDILIDVLILALPILIVRNLQFPLSKKIAVFFAFSFRIFAIAMTIFRLITLPPSLRKDSSHVNAFATDSSDLTMAAFLPTLATLLATFTSIFVACIPHLRPFMESLEAGFLSGVIHDSDNRSYGYGGSYAMNKVSASSRTDPLSTMRSERTANGVLKNANGQILVEKPSLIGLAVGTDDVVMPGSRRRGNSGASDGGGSSASHGSDAMIIKQTKGWSVQYEE